MPSPLIIIAAVLGVVSAVMIGGIALIKDKKEAFGFERKMGDMAIMRRLLGYAKPYLRQFGLVFVVMLFSIAADILLPLIIGSITDVLGVAGFAYSAVLGRTLVYVAVLIVSLVCTYLQAVLLQKTGQRIISQMRKELFVRIQSLSHQQLNGIPVGTLVTRVCNDTNSVSMMFTAILASLLKNVFLILGYTVAMFCVNVKLTLLVLCFAPFVVLFTVIFRKFCRRAFRRVKNATTDINVFLSENLSGIKVTQIFNQEQTKINQFGRKNRTLWRAQNREIIVFALFRPSIYMLYMFTVVAMFYVAGKGTTALGGVPFWGQMVTYSTIVIFYQYIASFFTPIQNMADQFNRMQSAFASSEKIFAILDMQPAVVDLPDAVETPIVGKIEFRHVWFAYVDEDWILKDVSFVVEAGQTVAFVGATGSGKTTILSLIVRNYDIQKGQILIDDRDIRGIQIDCLRRAVGQMLQDVFLFSGTIRSNIVLRDDNIDDQTVLQACRYVNADHFINKLEHGLDEEVRERGNNFSAGQRQLLSFARTIVHKPTIMILDEATANIDTETELLIQNSLEKLMNIGTMLMVAHRLSTVQHADNIIVLDKGVILEQGTHQQLLQNKGKYYTLYQLQYRKQQLQDPTV